MKHIVIILAIILAASHPTTAQDKDDAYLDSLSAIFFQMDDNDTSKITICDQIASGHYNADSTLAWAERLIKLTRIHNQANLEVKALTYMSWAYYYTDQYTKANECNYRSIIIADSIGDNSLKARNYMMLGDNYCCLKDYKQSTQYYNIALQLYEKEQDKEMMATCYRSTAQIYFTQKMYYQAEDYLQRAIEIDSTEQTYEYLLLDYQTLALMYLTKFLYNSTDKDTSLIDKAKQTIIKTNEIESESNYEYANYTVLDTKSTILFYEATIHGYKGEKLQSIIDSIQMCYEQGNTIIEKLQHTDTLCFKIIRANYYTLSKQYDNAKNLIDTLINALNDGKVDTTDIEEIYLACDNYYTAIKDYEKAYYYKSKYYENINSQTSIDYAVMATKDIAQAEFQERNRLREIEESRRSRFKIYIVIALAITLLIVSIEIIRSRRHNRALNEKNEKISTQNQRIKSSIHYASLIQHAAMPDETELNSTFAEQYIIYRPLDIVAGDFYWVNTAGKYKMAACADSTGHGVPGAFVSMLGISLLNDLAPTALQNNGSPALILNEMRKRLMYSLGQDKNKYEKGIQINMDGIELALAIIDTESDSLHYAGAYRPLWVYSNGAITRLKPDKMPIGIHAGELKDFNEQTMPIHKGDTLYMFSDGVPDQFGYTDDTKTEYKNFSVKKLLELVSEIAPLPFSEQKTAITSAIDTWPNGYNQIDDITFFAIKL